MDPQQLMLIVPLLLIVVMMFFMWRGNKKRQEQQQQMRTKLVPGVDVMTQAGILGTLVDIDEANNVATLESAPGSRVRVHSATIIQIIEPTVPDDASSLTGDTTLAPSEPAFEGTTPEPTKPEPTGDLYDAPAADAPAAEHPEPAETEAARESLPDSAQDAAAESAEAVEDAADASDLRGRKPGEPDGRAR